MQELHKLAEALKETIIFNTSIERLVIRNIKQGDAVLSVVAEALARSNMIKELILTNINCSEIGLICLARIIHDNSSIIKIDISHQPIGGYLKPVFLSIAQSTTLKSLRLSNVQLNRSSILELAESLKENKMFKEIDLSYNHLGNESLVALNQLLKKQHILEKINLEDTGIDRYFAIDFAKILHLNPQIKSLNLSKNKLNDIGVLSIVRNLHNSHNLTHIDLRDNNLGKIGFFLAKEVLDAMESKLDYQI